MSRSSFPVTGLYSAKRIPGAAINIREIEVKTVLIFMLINYHIEKWK
jgi:hypothetical protein